MLSNAVYPKLGFPGGSGITNLPVMQETWIQSLGWTDPLEEGMATHSNTPSWRTPQTEAPGRLQSMEGQRVGSTAHTLDSIMMYLQNFWDLITWLTLRLGTVLQSF